MACRALGIKRSDPMFFLQSLYVTWLSLFIPGLIAGKAMSYRRSGDSIDSEKLARPRA